ncbi:MAG: hypothetical protein IIA70_05030 [Proteobacteria bacterium]|nr:hypothetical protein [Pseudomonadota bacterium]
MAIIITPAYVLALAHDQNNPHIAYQTWVRDRVAADITVSSETAEGPKDAPLRPDTHEFWQADVLPATWRIDLGQPRAVDYVGIAGHTLGSAVRNFLSLPGTAGNFASSPDATPLDITGDIDLRCEVAPDDWTLATRQTFISKYLTTGNQRSYWFYIDETAGTLRINLSDDGVTAVIKSSTVVPGFTNGSRHWVRVTVDVDNGASGYDVKFYTSDDGVNWTQLGSTVTTATATSFFNSTALLDVGVDGAGSNRLKGKVYRAQVLNGIDGPIVFDANFSDQAAGTLSFKESSSNAATVTINQSGSPQAEIIKPAPATLLVEHSPDNSAWTPFASALAPVTDAPILFLDVSLSRRYWRITLTGVGDPPKIAVIYIGEVLVVQRSIYGGHSPAVLSRDTTLYQNMSDGGQFLGQYVKRRGVNGNVSLRHLKAGWYRANFDPFVKAAREFPFFFAWRPVDWPLEVAYGWADADIRPSNMGIRDLMQVNFDFKGVGYAD